MMDLFNLLIPFIVLFSPILIISVLQYKARKGIFFRITIFLVTFFLKVISLIIFGSYEHISGIIDDFKRK